jgi:hypothetical protein
MIGSTHHSRLGRSSKCRCMAGLRAPQSMRGSVYLSRFPPLAECRKRFEELMQSSIDWNSRKIKGLPYLSDLPTCFGKFVRKSRDSETHPRGQTNIFLQLL